MLNNVECLSDVVLRFLALQLGRKTNALTNQSEVTTFTNKKMENQKGMMVVLFTCISYA